MPDDSKEFAFLIKTQQMLGSVSKVDQKVEHRTDEKNDSIPISFSSSK
jgi:hypothetical protein